MSSFFKVCDAPRPEETIPRPGWTTPGIIVKRFEPNPSMLDWIDTFAPLPIETIAITEAMPMTMPSMVRPERTLLAERELYVSFAISLNFIYFLQFFFYELFCLLLINRLL